MPDNRVKNGEFEFKEERSGLRQNVLDSLDEEKDNELWWFDGVTTTKTPEPSVATSPENITPTKSRRELDEEESNRIALTFSQAFVNAKTVNLDEKNFLQKEQLSFIGVKTKNLNASTADARVFFGKGNKKLLLSYFETGTILDHTLIHIMKLIDMERTNRHLEKMTIFEIPKASTDVYDGDDIATFCLDISRDLYLLLGVEDPTQARLGNYSSLRKLFVDIYRNRLIKYYLNNELDYDFAPVTAWLMDLKKGFFLKKEFTHKLKDNLRVILAVINHYFYDLMDKYFFYGFQAGKETRFTAGEICGKYNFKCHNPEVLSGLVSDLEKGLLLFWFEGEKAEELKTATRNVFTHNKFYLLQTLKRASNDFDKCVSKVIIKALYHRNKVRSELAAKKREALKGKDVKNVSTSKSTSVTYEEVRAELVRRRDIVWLNPYLISVGVRYGRELSLELALRLCVDSFGYDALKNEFQLKDGTQFADDYLGIPVDVRKELEIVKNLGIITSEKAISQILSHVGSDGYATRPTTESLPLKTKGKQAKVTKT